MEEAAKKGFNHKLQHLAREREDSFERSELLERRERELQALQARLVPAPRPAGSARLKTNQSAALSTL